LLKKKRTRRGGTKKEYEEPQEFMILMSKNMMTNKYSDGNKKANSVFVDMSITISPRPLL